MSYSYRSMRMRNHQSCGLHICRAHFPGAHRGRSVSNSRDALIQQLLLTFIQQACWYLTLLPAYDQQVIPLVQ
jgi:hypothetical protein